MNGERACNKAQSINDADIETADGQTMLEELQAMLDRMNSQSNFNRVARNLKATYASTESIVVEFQVRDEHVNSKGTLHGGQTAALLDIVTARAVGMSMKSVPMVSVDISISGG